MPESNVAPLIIIEGSLSCCAAMITITGNCKKARPYWVHKSVKPHNRDSYVDAPDGLCEPDDVGISQKVLFVHQLSDHPPPFQQKSGMWQCRTLWQL